MARKGARGARRPKTAGDRPAGSRGAGSRGAGSRGTGSRGAGGVAAKSPVTLRQIGPQLWEIPKTGGMRVPGYVYASRRIVADLEHDESPQQVANVAHLPGIVRGSYAMPDIHWGYGFPIGGVAATDPDDDGVISPGGVGYDINCGVRVLRTDLGRADLEPRMKELADELFRRVPSGVGAAHERTEHSAKEIRKILVEGAEHVVRRLGMGTEDDLLHTEEGGRLAGADPDAVSERAIERGRAQVGTLGSGNHFLEVGVADEIYRPEVAEALGVAEGTVCLLIHCGSRGLGYQVCDDSLGVMNRAVERYGIRLPDRQLCCAPLRSDEGRAYLRAMACAANYAWANRQTITHLARQAFATALGTSVEDLGMRLIYDVCHNIAKWEEHMVDGERRRLCVHRKGATRAFPAGDPRVPESLREVGQPVLVPGDMGRYSFVLVGAPGALEKTFGSTCHGAGRRMSRAQAKRESRGRNLIEEMAELGVTVRAAGMRTVAEEMPHAYKDVAEVVDVMEAAGISNKVFRLRPLAVIKG